MGEINKFMAEIIRLLTDLVAAVKQNEDLIRDTQAIVQNIAQSAGMQNLIAAGQSLENAISMLQKGVQVFQIQNTLRQVQDFLAVMGSAAPASGQVRIMQPGTPTPGQSQAGGSQEKTGDDSLIKPSDLFK